MCAFRCRCSCSPEWAGPNCEQEYVPCSPSPCHNGGSCIATGPVSYRCKCVNGEYMYVMQQQQQQRMLDVRGSVA